MTTPKPIPASVLRKYRDEYADDSAKWTGSPLGDRLLHNVAAYALELQEAFAFVVANPPIGDVDGYSGCAYCRNIYGGHYATKLYGGEEEPCVWEQIQDDAAALLPADGEGM